MKRLILSCLYACLAVALCVGGCSPAWAAEIIVAAKDQSFTTGNNWANGDCAAFNNNDTGDVLTATSSVLYQWFELAEAAAPTSAGIYHLEFTVNSVTGSWRVMNYPGTTNMGTVTTTGRKQFDFTANTHGGFSFNAYTASSSIELDDITLTVVPAGLTYYVDSSITNTNSAVYLVSPDFFTYNPTTFSATTGTDRVFVTIADLNAKAFQAGDIVKFRKGQTWTERLMPISAGSAGYPITYTSFGGGAQPNIIGGENSSVQIEPGINYITLSDLDLSAANMGISMNGNHHTVIGCSIHDMVITGIQMAETADNCTITKNEVYNIGSTTLHHAIYMEGSDSNVISYNKIHGVIGGSAFHLYGATAPTNNEIYGNVCYNNGQSVLLYSSATGNLFYNNVFWGSGGINIQTDGADTATNTFQNNIIGGSTSLEVYIHADAGTNTFDYNLYYHPSGNPFRNAATEYATKDLWTAAVSQDANSLVSDPKFVDAAGGKFWVKQKSPVYGKGVSIAGYNTRLMPASSWPSSVATKSTAGKTIGAYAAPRSLFPIFKRFKRWD